MRNTVALTLVLVALAAATTANAQQRFKEADMDLFLRASGITAEQVGMKWYRDCQLRESHANRATAWQPQSVQGHRNLIAQAAKLNQTHTDQKWLAVCRPQLMFPSAAFPAAEIEVERVSVRVDDQVFEMSEGDSLRFNACQPVRVLNSKRVLKQGCQSSLPEPTRSKAVSNRIDR